MDFFDYSDISPKTNFTQTEFVQRNIALTGDKLITSKRTVGFYDTFLIDLYNKLRDHRIVVVSGPFGCGLTTFSKSYIRESLKNKTNDFAIIFDAESIDSFKRSVHYELGKFVEDKKRLLSIPFSQKRKELFRVATRKFKSPLFVFDNALSYERVKDLLPGR